MFGKGILENKNLQGCSTCDSSGRNCVNETDSGQGVEGADFVLYITAITTDQVRITKEKIFLIHLQCLESVGGEAETVAYAAHCQQESGLDRPVAGVWLASTCCIRGETQVTPTFAPNQFQLLVVLFARSPLH